MWENLTTMETFAEWLQKELNSRNMTQSDLSRTAGLGSGTLSNILRGTRSIGYEAVLKIANAFNLPPEIVFRAAGMLPNKPEKKEIVEKILYVISELPESEQSEILEYILWRQKQLKKKN